MTRENTKKLYVGNVPIGGGAPVAVQSMCNTKTGDPEATLAQMRALKTVADAHSCVDKVELLPFRKLCETKYEALGIPFPLAHLPEPTREQMAVLNAVFNELREVIVC